MGKRGKNIRHEAAYTVVGGEESCQYSNVLKGTEHSATAWGSICMASLILSLPVPSVSTCDAMEQKTSAAMIW